MLDSIKYLIGCYLTSLRKGLCSGNTTIDTVKYTFYGSTLWNLLVATKHIFMKSSIVTFFEHTSDIHPGNKVV